MAFPRMSVAWGQVPLAAVLHLRCTPDVLWYRNYFNKICLSTSINTNVILFDDNGQRPMKPGSRARGRVNAGLASLVPSAALTRPLGPCWC